MCVQYDGACDGWSHPLDQTLHVGDIIIIQQINPADLNANYPNSDIIVYENPQAQSATPIVHRIVAKYELNGTIYFETKGDGNGKNGQRYRHLKNTIPTPSGTITGREYPRSGYWQSCYAYSMVWMGNSFLKNNPLGFPAVIGLILLLVVLKSSFRLLKRKLKPRKRCKTGVLKLTLQLYKLPEIPLLLPNFTYQFLRPTTNFIPITQLKHARRRLFETSLLKPHPKGANGFSRNHVHLVKVHDTAEKT